MQSERNTVPPPGGQAAEHVVDESAATASHPPRLPHTALSGTCDRLIRGIGDTISWIWLALIAIIIVNVTARYAFGEGRVEFEEIQWHVYAIGFLIGLSYCLESDDHVRVDVLYERFEFRTKAWIELVGIFFFLLPFVALAAIFAVPFIAYSVSINEISEAPGGLPARWAIKAVLLLGLLLLAIAAVSRLLRVTAYLFGVPKPSAPASAE